MVAIPCESEAIIKDVKRRTKRLFNPEEKIAIVLEGLSGAEYGNWIHYPSFLWHLNFVLTQTWRYWKHWDSGITRDSKRVFGIFRTKLTRSKEASSDQKELHRCISTVPMDITIHSWGGNWTPSQKSLYLISYVSAIGWNALRGRLGCLAGWLSEKSSCKQLILSILES